MDLCTYCTKVSTIHTELIRPRSVRCGGGFVVPYPLNCAFTIQQLCLPSSLISILATMISLERSFLLAAGFETLVYGLFFCIFGATLILQFTSYSNFRSDRHGHTMTTISTLMFVIATVHLATNWYRMLSGFVDHNIAQGGVVSYLNRLNDWSRIVVDTLYPSQENLGSAAAAKIYRTFILYQRDWKVIIPPIILFVGNIVAEISILFLYIRADTATVIFDHGLQKWITSFFTINVCINIITTSMMAFRIWSTHQYSSRYNAENGSLLMSILRIFLESAALQLVTQIVLLILYAIKDNAQEILLQSAVPIVGITFNVIAIRIRIHLISSTKPMTVSHQPADTIGSVRLRPLVVHVSTATSVVENNEGESEAMIGGLGKKSSSLQSSPV
ncbi:hypothetical protein D9758_002434 [Tetrapyrgos nigripes]|uniref:Uncharacterized protein n=1 Tax=Tetrapyrgos nigripes TaxID=182062 RepID=A0A8H5LT67_9AGAR|nr:hypothetical protein D9758_002434 [Tetrapyrgos nigripes]